MKNKEFYNQAPHLYDLIRIHYDTDVWRKFAIWLLVDPKYGVIHRVTPYYQTYNIVEYVAELLINNCQDKEVWKKTYKRIKDTMTWGQPGWDGRDLRAMMTVREIASQDPEISDWAILWAADIFKYEEPYQTMLNKLIDLIKEEKGYVDMENEPNLTEKEENKILTEFFGQNVTLGLNAFSEITGILWKLTHEQKVVVFELLNRLYFPFSDWLEKNYTKNKVEK